MQVSVQMNRDDLLERFRGTFALRDAGQWYKQAQLLLEELELCLKRTQLQRDEAKYLDLVFDGILPDGSVQWDVSGMVRALRNAARAKGEGAWMPLDEAIVWIRREDPTQIPSRYRCSTYRQAIHESRAFDVRREPGGDGRMVFLYRPRD